MAQQQTAKEQHDELIGALKAGTHTLPMPTGGERSVLTWAEYEVAAGLLRFEPEPGKEPVPHPHAGKLVVSVQYAGTVGGAGGLLRDYVFDPELLAAEKPADNLTANKAEKAR